MIGKTLHSNIKIEKHQLLHSSLWNYFELILLVCFNLEWNIVVQRVDKLNHLKLLHKDKIGWVPFI